MDSVQSQGSIGGVPPSSPLSPVDSPIESISMPSSTTPTPGLAAEDTLSSSERSEDDMDCSSDEGADGGTSIPRRQYDFASLDYTGQESLAEKINIVLALWRHMHLTSEHFLQAWASGRDFRDPKRSKRVQHRRTVLSRVVEKKGIASSADDQVCTLEAELDQLVGKPFFCRYRASEDTDLEHIDFSEAYGVMSRSAPRWTALLERLGRNQRAHRASYQHEIGGSRREQRMYVVTILLMTSRAQKKTSFFPISFGMYLAGNKVPRRAIEVLAGMGLCQTYKRINRAMTEQADMAKVRMSLLRLTIWILTVSRLDSSNWRVVLMSSWSTTTSTSWTLLETCG